MHENWDKDDITLVHKKKCFSEGYTSKNMHENWGKDDSTLVHK